MHKVIGIPDCGQGWINGELQVVVAKMQKYSFFLRH